MGKRRATRRQNRKKNNQGKAKNMDKKTTNFKTTTTTTWKSPKADCHHGQNIVFTTASGINVYGGGRNRGGGWWKTTPMVQLAIGPSETMKPFNGKVLSGSTVVPDGWSCDQFVGRIDPPLIISMDFPDFGVPQVEDYFWYALVDDIHEHNIKSVSTQCAGGHGRTGVQLAILFYLLNDDMVRSTITSASQLIEHIRDLHCHHAVETNEQQKYIARVLDIEVGESVIVERYAGYNWGTDTGKAQTTKSGTNTIKAKVGSVDADLFSEKYTMLPTKGQDDDDIFASDDVCECCGHDSYDMAKERCWKCHWELPYDADKLLCYTCGNNKPAWSFLTERDDECIMCQSRSRNIKVTTTDVECHKCGVLRPQDMVTCLEHEGFVCLTCESGTKIIHDEVIE